jgi:membrane protein YqaA with SNARE-associated domain
LILAEAGVVLVLLLIVVLSEEVRQSTNLWVLFLYSFPSEFLVGLVPHEPVLIFFGDVHSPLVVALVAVVSTVMAEGLNYSFFGLFYDMPAFRAALEKDSVRKIADLFNRAPFLAILVAGFTPVPFFPVRFLVVIAEYPVWKYMAGVFLSRAPRFYLLAMFGSFFDVPGALLATLFLGMLFLVNVPAVVRILRDNKPTPNQEGIGVDEERE